MWYYATQSRRAKTLRSSAPCTERRLSTQYYTCLCTCHVNACGTNVSHTDLATTGSLSAALITRPDRTYSFVQNVALWRQYERRVTVFHFTRYLICIIFLSLCDTRLVGTVFSNKRTAKKWLCCENFYISFGSIQQCVCKSSWCGSSLYLIVLSRRLA